MIHIYTHNTCTRFLCMNKILVHAQHSCARNNTLVHALGKGTQGPGTRLLSKELPFLCASNLSKLVTFCTLQRSSPSRNKRVLSRWRLRARNLLLQKCCQRIQLRIVPWFDGTIRMLKLLKSTKSKFLINLKSRYLTHLMQQSGVFNTFLPCAPGGQKRVLL